MARRKSYLVKFYGNQINYPDRCPVCGDLTTTTGLILSSNPLTGGIFSSVRTWVIPIVAPPTTSKKTSQHQIRLEIPVCELHFSSPFEREKTNWIGALLGGLGLFTILLMSFFIIGGLIDSQVIFLPYLYLLVFGFFLATPGFFLLRKSPLERSISIYLPQTSSDMVCLEVDQKWYAKELLKLNPDAVPLKRVKED
ncbi:MAG: hypothetical protein GF411_19230 [Candidatus Lokiarchaeota archaeon]|nr:hypothetical protein [Candidatus Lokiarchaeota archaeon]